MRAPIHLHTPLVLLHIAVLGLATPVKAKSFPPIPNVTAPACVRLVASDGAKPARAFGEFEVVVRDLANNPIPGAAVRVDFSAVAEMRIAADQLDPEAIVDCAGQAVTKLSDANGRAVFCIIGSNIPGAPGSTLLGGGRIFADGFLVATPTASTFDLDGARGVDGGDLAVFLADFISGVSLGRSDYDCNGSIGGGDLSSWLAAFAGGTPSFTAPGCP